MRHSRDFIDYLLSDEAAALFSARNATLGADGGGTRRSYAAEDEILRFHDGVGRKRRKTGDVGDGSEASGTSGRRRFAIRPPAMTRGSRADMESAEGLDVGAEIRKVIRTMIEGECEAFPPQELLRSVWRLVPSFAGNEQQDAHEFMRFLLDRLRKELSLGKYAVRTRGIVTPRQKEHSPGNGGIPHPPTRARSARKRSGRLSPSPGFLKNDGDDDLNGMKTNSNSDHSSYVGMANDDDKEERNGAESGENDGYIIISRWGAKKHKRGCICRPCKAKRKLEENGGGSDANDGEETSTMVVSTTLSSPIASTFVTPSRLSRGVTASEVREKLEESQKDVVPKASPRSPTLNTDKEDDKIMELFGGVAVTRVTCMTCERFTERREPFMDLSLPIPSVLGKNGSAPTTPVSPSSDFVDGEGPNGEVTLQQCLAAFVRNETLSGHGRYFCEGCGKVQSATKSTRIAKLPPILCLHLKRFTWKGHTTRTKLTNDVDFPLDDLDLAPYCESDGEGDKKQEKKTAASSGKSRTPLRGANASAQHTHSDKLYDLIAVVTHHGSSASSGHYTACARELTDDGSNGWQHFNDDEVNLLTPEEVRSGQGYIFLYARRPTEPS